MKTFSITTIITAALASFASAAPSEKRQFQAQITFEGAPPDVAQFTMSVPTDGSVFAISKSSNTFSWFWGRKLTTIQPTHWASLTFNLSVELLAHLSVVMEATLLLLVPRLWMLDHLRLKSLDLAWLFRWTEFGEDWGCGGGKCIIMTWHDVILVTIKSTVIPEFVTEVPV